MNPLTALPTKVRKWIYVFYATLGIAFGATQVGYATAHADQPTWLLVAFGVFGYLGTALGLVAAANAAAPGTEFADEIRRQTEHTREAIRRVSLSREELADVKRRLDCLPTAVAANVGAELDGKGVKVVRRQTRND